MKNVLIYNLKTLTAFLLCIFAVQIGCAQTINAPNPSFAERACQSSDSEEYTFSSTYSGSFPSTTIFELRMTDVGTFDTEGVDYVVVDTVNIDTSTNEILFSLSFPEGTAGENFRFQVATFVSGVEITSSRTSSQYAIYVFLDNVDFKVEPRCSYLGDQLSAVPEDRSNNEPIEFDSYAWYRRDDEGSSFELVEGVTSKTFTPTELGQYISFDKDYGSCFDGTTGFNFFNFATVREALTNSVSIIEGPSISLCADETQILNSSETSDDFSYAWYKDGVQLEDVVSDDFTVTGSETPTLAVTGIEMDGEYVVGITTDDSVNEDTCTDQSDIVTITLENPEIQITSDENVILFTEGQTTTLVSEVLNGDEPYTYTWYLDGEPLENSNSETIEVSEAGVYTVSLEAVSECDENFVFADESVTVGLSAGVESIVISVNDDYISCVSELAILQVDSVVFALEGGGVVALSSDELEGIEFDWFRDGESTGVTESVYTVDSASENGAYTVVVDGVSSEEVSIVLALETFQIT